VRIALHPAGECQFTGRELGQVALAAWLGVGTSELDRLATALRELTRMENPR